MCAISFVLVQTMLLPALGASLGVAVPRPLGGAVWAWLRGRPPGCWWRTYTLA
eukprot:CAMPEP_0195106632 /NCGR_PEP_ID=MMETSP0448-20130528/81518_1 /TAXON_ID=66468 /ORGANISM="Heterocapsa triquestra, Strain CCMP 448" /LENGTH=52 /DNA_ID=CAMNT_0040142929 /DNA_START=115 /DNA_END=269 /DNA_ORIENTATION=-